MRTVWRLILVVALFAPVVADARYLVVMRTYASEHVGVIVPDLTCADVIHAVMMLPALSGSGLRWTNRGTYCVPGNSGYPGYPIVANSTISGWELWNGTSINGVGEPDWGAQAFETWTVESIVTLPDTPEFKNVASNGASVVAAVNASATARAASDVQTRTALAATTQRLNDLYVSLWLVVAVLLFALGFMGGQQR